MQLEGNRSVRGLFKQPERILRWLFVALLFFILLPYGSVEYLPLHLAATGFFIVAALASLICPPPAQTRTALTIAVTVAALLAIWLIIQAMGVADNPLANPIWKDVERAFGPVTPSISIAPGDTLQGLVSALLPFAIFVTAILLFQEDRQSLWLIKAIVIPGIALTLVGLIQFELFPDMLLFEKKHFYLQSLTVVFVNSNTAATYLAMLLVFSIGLAFHSIQNAGFRQLLRYVISAPSATRPADARNGIFYLVCATIVLVALLLTKSRAGVGSGIFGVIILAVVLAYFGRQPATRRIASSFSKRRSPRSASLMRVGLVLVAILVVGAALSGQVMLRAQVQGSNDIRFCFMPGILQMVRDNWLTGTGFGSFRYAFPAYRDPSCGLEGVLTRAHDFYLEAWITLGLPFVILTSIIVVSLFFYFIKGVGSRRQFRWIPAAGLAVLLIQILHNSIDFSIQIPAVAAIFAALMGAGVVVSTGRAVHARSSSLASPTTVGEQPGFVP